MGCPRSVWSQHGEETACVPGRCLPCLPPAVRCGSSASCSCCWLCKQASKQPLVILSAARLQSSARARVLELVAEELEERFAALGPAAAAAGRSTSHSQEAAVLNRRLYNVNLPSAELGQCRDLLRKLAAIDAARVAAEAVRWDVVSGRCRRACPLVA